MKYQISSNVVLAIGIAVFFLNDQVVKGAMNAQSVQSSKCIESGCSYTALDESDTPGDLAEKRGGMIEDDVRKHGSDEDQWRSFILDSRDTDSKALNLDLVKSAHFSMRLDPKKGLLHFQKDRLHQAFAIAAPARLSNAWAKQELCPNYGIQVLSASASGAVVVKYCQPFTYSKGKSLTSEEYYLYDIKTATMLALWFSSTGDESIPGPFVSPQPTVKSYANGYDLEWRFRDATNPSLGKIVMRNKYTFAFDKKLNSFELKCADLTSQPNSDGDMCDGPANLRLIINGDGGAVNGK